MGITGIICEYNPLHLGHKKQLDTVRALDPEGSTVCLMSGNFVQRGKPAIFHKAVRAKAALEVGADLVLELPVTAALSSAEGFAGAGVEILSKLCDRLCFGAETANPQQLTGTAQALLSSPFPDALRQHLDAGLSFPAARQAALASMGLDGSILQQPNNILAVEYCKAILQQGSPMAPMPILRQGAYHETLPQKNNPSATAVRQLLEQGGNWAPYVPEGCASLYASAPIHTLQLGEKAVLAKLRTMEDREFEALPYGSEGLWHKLMKNARTYATLEEVLTATKSKRYTRTRLDRMVMCAFLGLTARDLETSAPYVRALALNDRGRELLKAARQVGSFPNIGQKMDSPYQAIEDRCGSLYGLFAGSPEPPDAESLLRIHYHP